MKGLPPALVQLELEPSEFEMVLQALAQPVQQVNQLIQKMVNQANACNAPPATPPDEPVPAG